MPDHSDARVPKLRDAQQRRRERASRDVMSDQSHTVGSVNRRGFGEMLREPVDREPGDALHPLWPLERSERRPNNGHLGHTASSFVGRPAFDHPDRRRR